MLATEFFIGPVLLTFIIGLFSTLLLYWYSVRNHDYWTKRGIRQTKTVPILGSLYQAIKEHFHEIELKRYNEHGPIYGHYEMQKPVLSIADPAILRDILVKDFQFFTNRREIKTNNKILDSMLTIVRDDDWKRIRSIISPTFSTGKIRRMVEIFKDCSRTAINNFKNETSDAVDTKRIFGAYTMDVIASSAFSTKIDSHNDPDNEFISKAKLVFNQGFSFKLLLFLLSPRLYRFLGFSAFQKDAFDFFENITLQIIKERKRTGQVRNDFLQLLLDTAKEENEDQNREVPEQETQDSNYDNAGTNPHILKSVTSKNLSIDELVGQCVIFFLAGYDTTASTLAFASYLLALNANVQDKLRKEVDEALQLTNV